jgi:hypothetical protein
MTTMLSLILALMLTMGGSPAVSVNPVNSIGPESGVSHDITGKPRLGEFLKIYPVETKPNAGNPQLVLNLSFQYKKSPLINLYQAFGMNPPNRTDPYGLFDQLHMMYYNDENYMKRLWHDNPPTWEDIDNLLTEVSKDTQYVVEGGANLVFTTVQWVLHQSNALLCSLRGDDYYSYDLVTYKIDINDPAGIVPTIDTRPSAEKAIGMGGLDTVTGLYYWGESGINLLDPNLNAEEIEANKKTFFGGIPGVAVFVYGGYKYYEYVRSYSTPNYVESTYIGNRQGVINKSAGINREILVETELKNKYPGATVLKERLLRDSSGKKVLDPLTKTGRKLDHVVVKDGVVIDAVETTSVSANKAAQISKEMRIRNKGGVYIRDNTTGKLLKISHIKTRIVRKK